MSYINRIINKIKKEGFTSEEVEKIKNTELDSEEWLYLRNKLEPIFNHFLIHKDERFYYANKVIRQLKKMASKGLLIGQEFSAERLKNIRENEIRKRMERQFPESSIGLIHEEGAPANVFRKINNDEEENDTEKTQESTVENTPDFVDESETENEFRDMGLDYKKIKNDAERQEAEEEKHKNPPAEESDFHKFLK